MAGLRGVCMLLEKHRDVICEDLNVDEVVPELVNKGILGVEEEKALVNEDLGRAKAELLVSQLSKKGFAAFQEFCHVLEKSHPHLLTCFLMDVAAMSSNTPATVSSGGDSESLKSLDVALRERDRMVQERNELRGTLTKRKVNKRELNMNDSPLPPEPPDGDGGGGPPSYLELLSSSRQSPQQQGAAGGSSTAGSGGGSEISEERLTEVLEEPVTEELGGERVVWEYHHVSLNRVPGYGFGIAVSGGRDNPHFTTGDPSIAISDVLKGGPAEGKLHVNDRVLSANGVSLEHVNYTTAVQVLKDSGAVVRLYVKRRVVLPAQPEPQTLKVSLAKAKKKDDFGIVLGCKIYVKEITGRSGSGAGAELQEGDVILRINQQTASDGMSLKEARKLLEAARDRVQLVVQREPGSPPPRPDGYDAKESPSHHSRDSSDGRTSYVGHQNLYVQPPTRGADPRSQSMPPPPRLHPDDKNNLIRQNGRSRGPLIEASAGQLEPSLMGLGDEPPPPRPPLPRDTVDRPMMNGSNGMHSQASSDYYETRRQSGYNQQSPKSKPGVPDPRFVSFQKEGSVGIRLTGGNETGIFVTAVQAGSPAAIQGLQPGDKIIKVNGMEMKGVTREEAVLFLLSLQDQIDLIVQYRADEYDHIMATQRGDSFYIRTHFNYEQSSKNELSFRKGDIFHVVDTLNLGVVGAWQVFRIGRNNEETQKGVIPNRARAEELASAQLSAARREQGSADTTSRSRFFTRRRRQRRSKSLGKDHWEDVAFSEAVSQFPAYERVVLRGCGFVRPVVLFGAVADIARDLLLREMPDKFAAPQLDMGCDSKSSKSSGIIRLSAIRELVERGRHALLDVTPTAVDRLNLAQLYPVCIFLRAESKHIIKEVRAARQSDRSQSKSNKKLYEQCVKLEKLWPHVFTATITLTDADGWYRKVKELIDKQQAAPVWMAEGKAGETLSDDFLFPMTSRLSYASSPESDGEGGAETSPAVSPSSADSRLARSSSDPSLSAEDGAAPPAGAAAPAAQPPPPPYSPYKQDEGGRTGGGRGSHGADSRYGFSRYGAAEEQHQSLPPVSVADARSRLATSPPGSPVSPYQTLPHDFRTNGERGTTSPPPPTVERVGKPLSPPVSGTRSYGRAAGGHLRSYLERGDDSGPYMGAGKNFTLDRAHRTNTYDSTSSYDSYNRFSNMHDDLKARAMPTRDMSEPPLSPGGPSSRSHDPYRYTRSTAQPLSPAGDREPRGHSVRPEYQTLPTPGKAASSAYKPVPPPKPKLYRRGGGPGDSPLRQSADPRGSRDEFAAYAANGGDDSAGFDSGHGSSLDRNCEPAGGGRGYMSGGPGYYLGTSPAAGVPDPAGLDLATRDQRGSAFELYKKPLEARYSAPLTDHGASRRASYSSEPGGLAGGRARASARGVFDHTGGVLEDLETGVAVVVPPGAIRRGRTQEIYFNVCKDDSLLPPLDPRKGETLLSPLVMCGPQGLQFDVPVELRLPHCTAVDPQSWSFALKSLESPHRRPDSWQNVRLTADGRISHVRADCVSVLVDHF
ncbi:tight junction protein ZO-1-like isoform X2 [Amphibalanus amphitrite]|uniref:tight junction protein ZO-1-like isoform X2 n=1 Tax=Amphibalanus amphitrite TaxID=1232801 RepID=UPI001C90668D|nr:tight junction protein ZO-1-like isoform X2 [Amphibalanus amphitrite]